MGIHFVITGNLKLIYLLILKFVFQLTHEIYKKRVVTLILMSSIKNTAFKV